MGIECDHGFKGLGVEDTAGEKVIQPIARSGVGDGWMVATKVKCPDLIENIETI